MLSYKILSYISFLVLALFDQFFCVPQSTNAGEGDKSLGLAQPLKFLRSEEGEGH
jgi:hypothetical protein